MNIKLSKLIAMAPDRAMADAFMIYAEALQSVQNFDMKEWASALKTYSDKFGCMAAVINAARTTTSTPQPIAGIYQYPTETVANFKARLEALKSSYNVAVQANGMYYCFTTKTHLGASQGPSERCGV